MSEINHEKVLASPASHTKDEVRNAVRKVRGALDEDVWAVASEKICETVLELEAVKRAETVFIYVGYGKEVATLGLIEKLLEGGKRVCVPRIGNAKGVVKKGGEMKVIELLGLDVLKENSIGVLEPRKGKAFLGNPDVTVTPCVAATKYGARLGQGGGYYDRYFEKVALTVRMCLAFECQVLGELPASEHDAVMDLVVTEEAVYQRDEVAIDEDGLWEET
ncbi:5-formyltetrahydrofolate cyclo-ligase [Poriferisphaera sp. WC338]|uniref:5-formyltetrahydrofolate cyclo-ligase n=1 Tax=Poriferisphaera sp. WC338 TaxID=3425129 RepID=UPI003D81677E